MGFENVNLEPVNASAPHVSKVSTSEDFGPSLLIALRSQGCIVPGQLLSVLRGALTLSAQDPRQAVGLADAKMLVQGMGWTLCPGLPRWDLPAHVADVELPWGSIWLGQSGGVWRVWQRSALRGWHPVEANSQNDTIVLPPDMTDEEGGGWLLAPDAQAGKHDENTSYWHWVAELLRGRVAGIFAASTLINLGYVILPLFSMLVYDKVVYNGVFETLWALAVGVLLFMVFEVLVRTLRARHVERLAVVLDQRIDRQLFSTLLRPSGRAGSQPGMAARFLTLYRDLGAARDFFSANYLLALADTPFIVFIWVVIGIIAWPLFLVAVVWTLIYVWWGSSIKKRSLSVSRALAQTQSDKQAVMTDAMSSLDLLRTSHAGGKMFQRFMGLADRQSLLEANLRHLAQQQAHLTQFVYSCNFVSILFVGAYLVFDQVITSGALVAVSMLSGRTLGAVSMALQTLGRWHELQSALKSLTPYLHSKAELLSTPVVRRDIHGIQGRIALVQLAHRYGDGEPVLHALNLRIAPGERVGLLGRPGSGKSTLTRLLAGAMLPSSGEVRVDDVALAEHDASDRCTWMAFKPQEATLVAGTVEDNILLGLPAWATRADRMAALQRGIYFSGLDLDLKAGYLSLGYMVEEYGANLSGGQRQKIALSRVLALEAKILILDEPTNGLDPESESMLISRLGELQGVTLIVVTHSARVLALTQRVLVLDQGRLIADGATKSIVKSAA